MIIFLVIFIILFGNFLLYLLFDYLKDLVGEKFGYLTDKTDFITNTLSIIHISILITILIYYLYWTIL